MSPLAVLSLSVVIFMVVWLAVTLWPSFLEGWRRGGQDR